MDKQGFQELILQNPLIPYFEDEAIFKEKIEGRMKERLDQILWKYGYVDSIDKAKRLIMLGAVIVNEQK